MKWIDFSAHNAKLLLRDTSNTKYLVVTSLCGELDAKVIKAFIKRGFVAEDDKLIAVATPELWETLRTLNGVKSMDVTLEDIQDRPVAEPSQQAIQETAIDALPALNNEQAIAHKDSQQDNLQKNNLQKNNNSSTCQAPQEDTNYNPQENPGQAVLTKEQRLAVELSKQFIYQPDDTEEKASGVAHGVLSPITLTHEGKRAIDANAVLWIEQGEPRMAFVHGEFYKVIGLTDKRDNYYFNFEVIENTVEIPKTYEEAFEKLKHLQKAADKTAPENKIALTEKSRLGDKLDDDAEIFTLQQRKSANTISYALPSIDNNGVEPNARGEFKASDSVDINYSTNKAKAYVRVLQYHDAWMATYGYTHNQGNFLSATPPITLASTRREDRDDAIVEQLDILIRTQSSILNEPCSQSLKKEAQGIIDWAKDLQNRIKETLSESQEIATDSNKL